MSRESTGGTTPISMSPEVFPLALPRSGHPGVPWELTPLRTLGEALGAPSRTLRDTWVAIGGALGGS